MIKQVAVVEISWLAYKISSSQLGKNVVSGNYCLNIIFFLFELNGIMSTQNQSFNNQII